MGFFLPWSFSSFIIAFFCFIVMLFFSGSQLKGEVSFNRVLPQLFELPLRSFFSSFSFLSWFELRIDSLRAHCFWPSFDPFFKMSSSRHEFVGENLMRDQDSQASLSRDRTEEVPQNASEEVTSSHHDCRILEDRIVWLLRIIWVYYMRGLSWSRLIFNIWRIDIRTRVDVILGSRPRWSGDSSSRWSPCYLWRISLV